MIGIEHLRRELKEEKQDWRKAIQTEYVKGVIYGLMVAIERINRAYKKSKGEK